MIDIRLIRENPDLVRENIRKKFQDAKLPLVDEVIELDKANRAAINEASNLRAERNSLSKKIGMLMGQAKKDPSKLEEAEAVKAQVTAQAARLAELEKQEEELEAKIHKIMLTIPQIIDPSVPLGPDDSCNVEVQRFGEAVVPDFPIPYHTEIMERFDGIDLDAARRVSGNGFYYLMGDIARLHEAVLAYARDFMIGKGFTYCIPPFMIHGNVVEGVMSQTDMDAMMYKIEGEDLYLIGTSEHSMIGRYIDQILTEDQLPQTMTSYSPCFRKEKGAHGIEERGVYRIHQFEKQEMIVVCRPEESMDWYEKLWRYSVELFRSLDIPVRQLECCSGDLADLKVKSCDIEAWSPRQQKYFEVCSCSNLGDAQARRYVHPGRSRPDIRHRRLDAAAAAGAEGPDGFPGQVIAVQEGVDDSGRGAPPDGIAQIDGAILGQVQGLARDPGPGGGVLLLLAGPAGIVVIAQVLAGVGLLRGQLIQVRPGHVPDALRRRPGVAGAGEIDHRHPGAGPAAAGTAGGISAVSGISGTACTAGHTGTAAGIFRRAASRVRGPGGHRGTISAGGHLRLLLSAGKQGASHAQGQNQGKNALHGAFPPYFRLYSSSCCTAVLPPRPKSSATVALSRRSMVSMTRMSLSMSMASARYSSSSCRSNPATMLSMVL